VKDPIDIFFDRNPDMLEVPSAELYTPAGWVDVVLRALEELKDLKEEVKVFQIKEKFAGLRIYLAPCTEQVNDIVRRAEVECSQTCMKCGRKGATIRSINGWMSTLCDECGVA